MRKTESSLFHDEIAEKYESKYTSPYWELYDEISWRNIEGCLPRKKNAVILDAGGGTGYWSRRLAKLGFRMVCADLAQKMLDVGRKQAEKEKLGRKIEFIRADITDMRCFGDGTFDMVLAEGDPVGYCMNPRKAVAELSRVARRGAYIVISVDGFFRMLAGLIPTKNSRKIGRSAKSHVSEYHVRFPQYNFTVDELKILFRDNGLEVKRIIGKPVFADAMPRDEADRILSDKRFFKRFLALEMRFNAEPSIIGLSHHIEAVGRKIR